MFQTDPFYSSKHANIYGKTFTLPRHFYFSTLLWTQLRWPKLTFVLRTSFQSSACNYYFRGKNGLFFCCIYNFGKGTVNTEIIRKISKLTATNEQTSDKREGGGKEGSEKMKSSPVKISILTSPCEKNLSLIICYYTEKEAPFLGTKHLYHKKRLCLQCVLTNTRRETSFLRAAM